VRPGAAVPRPLPSGTAAAVTAVRVKFRLGRPIPAAPRPFRGPMASRKRPGGEPWRADAAGGKLSPSIRPGGIDVADGPSVTTSIALLRAGDAAAAQPLWERYFARLVAFARGKLHGVSRRAADEEDVALSAFHSFCQAAQRFPRLNDRDDLWQVLVMLTARKAFQERRGQQALKRGGTADAAGTRTAEAAEAVALDEIVGAEPTPEFAVSLAEHFEALLAKLPSEELRQIAQLRLEEYSAAEIAERLGCTERTVSRKLVRIRSYWGKEPP